MITIKNGDFHVKINEMGATLDSIKKNGEEFLWQGDEKSWTGKDVAIFPFVARLKDGFYLHKGKEYKLKTHGIIRYSTLNISEQKDNYLKLTLSSNEETRAVYPFEFIFNAHFLIKDDTLFVNYEVINMDDKPIYFGIGGHPAIYIPSINKDCEDDISGNSLIFNRYYDLNNYLLDKTGCFIVGDEHFGKIDRLNLSKELFKKYPTLMLHKEEVESLIVSRKDNKKIEMKFSNADILALWSNPTFGSYVCIEPWSSIPDALNPKRELEQKESIKCLNKSETFNLSYSIKIL